MAADARMNSNGQRAGGRDGAGPDAARHDAYGPDATGPDAIGQAKAGFSEAKPRGHAAPRMPDPRKLAQDWITLWQSELSAMAADPEIRESWQTVMTLWAGTMSAVLQGLPRAGRPNAAKTSA